MRAAEEMFAGLGGRAGFSGAENGTQELGFSPGPPRLKPLPYPCYFAGLTPGASTLMQDSLFAGINKWIWQEASQCAGFL
jgi:hypothetical protein